MSDAGLNRRALVRYVGASLASAACFPSSFASAQQRSLRAIVVGIDRYTFERPLKGAVNDAEDIADALKSSAPTVVKLVNAQATRSAILSALRGLIGESQSGDTVIFAYAGHGGHEPATGLAGAKQEILLLGSFSPRAPGNGERLRGEELVELFAVAGQRGVNVIFVADACYSGGLVRPFDTRTLMMPTRVAQQEIYDLIDDPLPPVKPQVAKISAGSRPKMPNLIFLSAALPSEQSPETLIDGKARGALSWAFARALRGAAAPSEQGLRLGHLRAFVIENVRMQTGTRQTPDVLPTDDPERVVFRIAQGTETLPQPRGIKLFVIGERSTGSTLQRVTRVSKLEDAELTWDAGRREVVENGDLTASDVGPETIQAVVDKALAIRALQRANPQKPLVMRLLPSDRLFKQGAEISFVVDGRDGPNLVLFSLASDGKVEFHFPRPEENPRPPLDQPVKIRLEVAPPFGADHLVAVASEDNLADLAQRLRSHDGKRASLEAASLVTAMKGRRHQLGLQPLFTTR